tara:strand:- start:2750 stop:2974 length:225 start_codon:yes stop_codon:yes gene_type:complete
MPSKAKCQMGWKKMGYKSMSDCMSYGEKKMGKPQQAGTSAKAEQNMVQMAKGKSQNVRMKNKLRRQAEIGPLGN